MTTTKNITTAQLITLCTEAAMAGDTKMVAICRRAIDGSQRAIAACVKAIRAAEAMS
jgi:hypothetical protein